MDSGFLFSFLPLMFAGGLIARMVLRCFLDRRIAVALAALMPPVLCIAIYLAKAANAPSGPIAVDIAVFLLVLALASALVGSLTGAWLSARAERSGEF